MSCERCEGTHQRAQLAYALGPTEEEKLALDKQTRKLEQLASWGVSIRNLGKGMHFVLLAFVSVDVIDRSLHRPGQLTGIVTSLLLWVAFLSLDKMFHTIFHAWVWKLGILSSKVITRAMKEKAGIS